MSPTKDQLLDWFDQAVFEADVDDQESYASHDVFVLLRIVGYEPMHADVINPPRWTRSEIVELMHRLEDERRWVPLHDRHIDKLSYTELEDHKRKVAFETLVSEQAAAMTIDDLLATICMMDNTRARVRLTMVVKNKVRDFILEVHDKLTKGTEE